MVSFQVNFKGKIIPMESWPLDSKIHELKEYLVENTDVPTEFQRLLYKGNFSNDAKTLRECNYKSGIKVMLIGSSQEEVRAVKETDSKFAQLSNKPKSKYAINPYKAIKKVEDLSGQGYKFHRIQVIEHFPEKEKAREILERLCNDRGIRAIMKKHKWNVGTLQELSPAEKTLLGYNRNSGQLISLRLRTDDMEGFRLYADIRKVLLHELAHNVWTGHGDDFHRLNRQLNKEVVELDWTASEGHKLSNEEFYNPPEEEEIDKKTWQGGIYVLGGSGNSDRSQTPRRELLAQAALIRLTKEEKEINEGCGSEKINN